MKYSLETGKGDYLYRDNYRSNQKGFNHYALTCCMERPFDFFLMQARYKFSARMLTAKKRILDIGCGEGWGTSLLKNICQKSEVTALDKDSNCISFFKEYTFFDIRILESDFFDFTEDTLFDGCVCLDVIEHLPPETVPVFLDKISSHLTDDGQLILGTPSAHSAVFASQSRVQAHLKEYTPDELTKMLRKPFKTVNLFSMSDECVNTSFLDLAWYLMAVCS